MFPGLGARRSLPRGPMLRLGARRLLATRVGTAVGCCRPRPHARGSRLCSSGSSNGSSSGSGSGSGKAAAGPTLRGRLLAALAKDGSQKVSAELSLSDTLRRIFQAARPELPMLGGAAVALVVSSATTLIFPKAVGYIVDTIAPAAEPGASDEAREEARSTVKKMSAALGVVFLVGAATSFARVALLRLAGERLVARRADNSRGPGGSHRTPWHPLRTPWVLSIWDSAIGRRSHICARPFGLTVRPTAAR